MLTQRWEASLWLAGKQMYLGGFQDEDDAARAYDLAALACKGPTVPTNFPAEGYSDSLAEIGGSSRVARCAAHAAVLLCWITPSVLIDFMCFCCPCAERLACSPRKSLLLIRWI